MGIDQLACEVMQGAFDDESKWREGSNSNKNDFESAIADIIVKGIEVPMSSSSSQSSVLKNSELKSLSKQNSQTKQTFSDEVYQDHKQVIVRSDNSQKCDADFIYKQISQKKTSSKQSKIKLSIHDFAGQKLFTVSFL